MNTDKLLLTLVREVPCIFLSPTPCVIIPKRVTLVEGIRKPHFRRLPPTSLRSGGKPYIRKNGLRVTVNEDAR